MRKQIVLCADGTGNSGGKGYSTNVWRLFNAIDLRCHESDASKPKQIAFYDDGVGTEDLKLFKLIGGAFGYGLSRNIRELYEALARNYTPEDLIFVFGFSRGAFTARSLTGLIAECGVVDLQRKLSHHEIAKLRHAACSWRTLAFVLQLFGYFRWRARNDAGSGFEQSARIKLLVHAAFNTYRERRKRNSTGSLTWAWFQLLRLLPARLTPRSHDETIADFKKSFSADGDRYPRVECVGVWDTVGALGAPANWMRAIMNWLWSINFHDQSLHPCVTCGFQALAIDDERSTFKPILWNQRDAMVGRRIEQVWFAGVHSNVGGGYPKQGMASVSLYWMMRRAVFAGLVFQAGELERVRGQANVHDKLYDSRAGLASYYSYAPRNIAKLVEINCGQKPALIHYSVFERIASGVQDYIPANLPGRFVVVGDNFGEGHEHVEDAAALAYWQDRLRRAGVDKSKAALTEHWRAARVWIIGRQVLYYAMLYGTFGLSIGVVRLHRLALHPLPPPAPDQLPAYPAWVNLIDRLGAALVPKEALTRGMLMFDSTSADYLPGTFDRIMRPTLDYLGWHAGRLIAFVFIVVGYLLLRGWLFRRTQARFERFWSPLRGPIPDEDPPKRDDAPVRASDVLANAE